MTTGQTISLVIAIIVGATIVSLALNWDKINGCTSDEEPKEFSLEDIINEVTT